MKVTVAELGPAEFRSAIDGFVAVYAAAMKPPERMLAGRDIIMDRHAANPGFRGLAALVDQNALAGFTYGFHGAPGQWWHDVVAGALALGPRDGRAYLDDSFEVAELHAPFTHQELLLSDALGLDDSVRISPSGGALAGNAMFAAGLARIGHAARQISSGQVSRALGHATSGPALQQNLVCVMEAR